MLALYFVRRMLTRIGITILLTSGCPLGLSPFTKAQKGRSYPVTDA